MAAPFALAYVVVLQAAGDGTFTSHGSGHVALMVLSGVFTAVPLLLFAAAAGQPTILALGGLAYTFGLRHAFDADHIAAIDNTTRKLLQDGRKPVGVGFYFSLGHSTVVFIIAAALGLTVKWIVDGVAGGGGQLKTVGGMLGTLVSGGFLVLIGVLNLVDLLDIIRITCQAAPVTAITGRKRERYPRVRLLSTPGLKKMRPDPANFQWLRASGRAVKSPESPLRTFARP